MIGPNLSEWAIKRRSLVIFLMLAAVIAGTLSFLRLGRAEDPVFTFRTMVVFAAWPGASQEETQLQVTERIERKLQETRHLRHVRSYTVPGFTTIFVDLLGSTPPEVVPDVWYEVRKNIGDIRLTLPQGVIGPGFNDDFGDTFGIIYGFTADGFTERELRDYVEAARSRLLLVPDVSKVEVLGAQDERIFIEFSTERLAGLGLDFPTLLATLQQQNIVRPAGVIETATERITLRVSGSFGNEADIEGVNFSVDGRMVRLGDIAKIRRGFVDPPQPKFRVNGTSAIGLAIAMRDGGDILALGKNITAAMAEIRSELPHGIEATLVADQAVTVDTAIGEFMESLWQAIVIILVCSFIALGVRPGAVVALAIPLTLAIVFSVMEITGIDLQRISLGALIIALTLLVDDAMTTVDAMLRRLAAGDSKAKAATFAYSTLAAPMLAGTLITIAGFVPIGFAKSSAGEYTFSIFAVVGIALVVSWFVAVIFAPVIGMAILKPPKAGAGEAKPSKLLAGYSRFLQFAMKANWLTIAVTVGIFVASIYLLRHVPSQFFPASDRPELVVDLTLRQNASIFATEAQVTRLEEVLKADPDVDHFSSYVGRGAIRFILTLNVQLQNPFFGQLVIVAKDIEARDRLHAKLEKLLAEEFPELVSRVAPLELGPPVGWPVQYRVTGPDKDEVTRIAQGSGAGRRVGRRRPPRQFRLDRAVAQAEDHHRSGPGAPARRQFAFDRLGHERHRGGIDGDTGARQHLPDRRGCARRRPGARIDCDPALAAGADSRRPHRAPDAVCDLRVRPGVSDGVAAQPRADADGAGRRRAGSTAGRRRRKACSEDHRVRLEAPSVLQGRDWRRRRGERHFERIGVRRCAADADADADGADVHPAELPAAGGGAGAAADGPDRRRRLRCCCSIGRLASSPSLACCRCSAWSRRMRSFSSCRSRPTARKDATSGTRWSRPPRRDCGRCR